MARIGITKHLMIAFGLLITTASVNAYQDELPFCESEQTYLDQVKGQLNAPAIKEDFNCFQSIEATDLQHSLMVDTRLELDFHKVRIPNSVNLSETSLLHTHSLKTRPVLVVDKGFSRTGMAQLCVKAREAGFTQLKVLLGGLAGWHASGRSLMGLP
jgi:rhodanese-related sulfurtransferase